MKNIKSVSLLALLAVNGSALASIESDKVLIDICQEQKKSQYSVVRIDSNVDSDEIIRNLNNGLLSENEIQTICKFLEEHESSIDNNDRTIDKTNGFTR